ncbi:MAG: molybdopterin-guanine dinucleotide biosynthesis protein B [Alphaproteobacteria bacterium]|nr:molybdopterin-guanine dinucleotide biosynthesis protein B [Alphaproteobacteria bacterium]
MKRVLGIAGWSGSGKTTLVTALIPALLARGLTVSTLKHAHHNFDVDKPGKDSYEHRTAGATEVLVSSANRWALMHENRDGGEATLDDLIARMSPVDLILVEGWKTGTHPKIEVYRPSVGKPPLYPDSDSVVAVASDAPLPDFTGPVLDINDIETVTDFIVGWRSAEAA